jgi:class 3 adenylate cyclase/tetratricopeptide (TPR) repeat protein
VAVCASCGHETAEEANFCPKCGASFVSVAPAREVRKTVTVVFCDVTGSTALGESRDPESLRALLARYFEQMREIVESHGGSVEKFIGDAVMAVFGVPVTHEDDALRACRAAIEMRDAFPELGIAGRIGVNTGEVVTGTEERLATGDAVNVAARLEQAAQPGEVLVGVATLSLVRATVEVGAERRLELKGKAEPVPAYPLLAVTGEAERHFGAPMVGRRNELGRLENVFAQALHDGSCQLFTVLGSAGVGKSRLAAEFLAGLDARIVRGRCLSYGEGITYWPVVEILKQLGTLPEGDAARPLRSLLGETDEPASAEEIAWGFRKLLEQEARARPLVCVFDDLHWGEETLLDLVEHLADLSRDAPILLLCMARPELLERRPSWAGGKWNATTVLLEPLDAAETEMLLAELGEVPEELHERIVQVAEGNPLFLEEMLALVRESGGDRVEVPPTIQALLAARLDQLDPAERSVLEHGSVEGRVFHRGAVAALADGDGSVDQRLIALVRKELVRPDRAQLAGDDAYRFRHLLIRDAAYDALPKSIRAGLHQRFADWLEQHGRSLVELDEILGYHLEQAARYLADLGQDNREVAVAAADRLAAAARRATWRGDSGATALLERSLRLTRPFRLDLHRELDLASLLFWTGNVEQGIAIAEAAAERARDEGDQAGELLARTFVTDLTMNAGKASPAELESLARAALPLLEERQDHAGLVHVWAALAGFANMHCRFEDVTQAAEQGIRHARALGPDERLFGLGNWLALGPRPAAAALATLDAFLPAQPTPSTLGARAVLLAMLDRYDEAGKQLRTASEQQHELGLREQYLDQYVSMAAEVAGDYGRAAEALQQHCAKLEAAGLTAALSTYKPHLGRMLWRLGRHDEAEPLAQQGRRLGDPNDIATQISWRGVQALVHAHRGEHTEAERLAQEAVAYAQRTDSLYWQGEALADLAEVLETAGRRDEAIAAWQEALDRYEQKQAIPLARRTRERLSALRPTHE